MRGLALHAAPSLWADSPPLTVQLGSVLALAPPRQACHPRETHSVCGLWVSLSKDIFSRVRAISRLPVIRWSTNPKLMDEAWAAASNSSHGRWLGPQASRRVLPP